MHGYLTEPTTEITESGMTPKLELKNRNPYVHSETAFPISSLPPLSFHLSPFSFYYVPQITLHFHCEIGKIFKMKAQTVSKAGIKIERLMKENRKIKSQVNKLISIFEG